MNMQAVQCEQCGVEMQGDTDIRAIFRCHTCEKARLKTRHDELSRAWVSFEEGVKRDYPTPPPIFSAREPKGPIWSTVAQPYQMALKPFLAERMPCIAILYGPTGVGKSHVAWASVFNFLLRKERSVVWTSWSKLMLLAIDRNCAFGPARQRAELELERMEKAALLVIDEFGTTPLKDSQFHVIQALIDARYQNVRKTLATSTMTKEELVKNTDAAIVSRFWGGVAIEMNGADLRHT